MASLALDSVDRASRRDMLADSVDPASRAGTLLEAAWSSSVWLERVLAL